MGSRAELPRSNLPAVPIRDGLNPLVTSMEEARTNGGIAMLFYGGSLVLAAFLVWYAFH